MTPEQISRLPEFLFEIGKAIGSHENLANMLTRISELVTQLVGADATSIMLVDGNRQLLLGKAAYGLQRDDISVVSFRIGEGVAGWVAERTEPALIPDCTDDPRYKELDDSENRIRSMACVPLLYRDDLVGVMTATSAVADKFKPADIELLLFVAKTITLDIENIRLRRLSITDSLTGAYNREFLSQRLPAALDEAAQVGQPLSVAMIDVDHFKAINDRFGHDVGDSVLAEVAQRIRGSIRSEDLLVRYGGEEFLILLPNSNLGKAREISERMRERFQEQPVSVASSHIDVRVSVGVAQALVQEAGPALIRRADGALYKAKKNGRNRVEVAR